MLAPHLLFVLNHQLQTHRCFDAGLVPTGKGVCASGDGRRLRCKSGSHRHCTSWGGCLSPWMNGGRVGHGCGCWTFRSCCLICWCCGGIYNFLGCRSSGSGCHLRLWCCILHGCVCSCACVRCGLVGWGHGVYGCVLHSRCNCFHCLGCSLASCSCICCCCGYYHGRRLASCSSGGCSCPGCHVGGWCCGYLMLACSLRSCCMAHGVCAVRLNRGASMGRRMIKGKWVSRSNCMVEGCGLWRLLGNLCHFSAAGRKCYKKGKKMSSLKPLHCWYVQHNCTDFVIIKWVIRFCSSFGSHHDRREQADTLVDNP